MCQGRSSSWHIDYVPEKMFLLALNLCARKLYMFSF
jgi:Uri superfamily endonuclease